ncbi:MAG: hypothetical protein GEU98_21515 [Pseudonocardiaceae bacterium]|nr:hypothetical protein [Pseudonocardiaceae bacterium]
METPSPRPDPATGLPRPPNAPLPDGVVTVPDRTGSTSGLPDPPEGMGPVLESFRPSQLVSVFAGLIGAGVVALFLILKDGGFGWASNGVLWAPIVVVAVVLYVSVRRTVITAGADWLMARNWVRTYELGAIRLDSRPKITRLTLQDTSGRQVRVELADLCGNSKLWDLVYNGIRHSVAGGDVEVNEPARRWLGLPSMPDDQRLVAENERRHREWRENARTRKREIDNPGRMLGRGLAVLLCVLGAGVFPFAVVAMAREPVGGAMVVVASAGAFALGRLLFRQTRVPPQRL